METFKYLHWVKRELPRARHCLSPGWSAIPRMRARSRCYQGLKCSPYWATKPCTRIALQPQEGCFHQHLRPNQHVHSRRRWSGTKAASEDQNKAPNPRTARVRLAAFVAWLTKAARACAVSARDAAPFAALMLLLTIGNTMADQAKDVVVLNILGAKWIPFLQVYAVLPLSILFLWGYQVLQQFLSRRVLFPVIICILVSLKLLAAHFLLPQAVLAMAASSTSDLGLLASMQPYLVPALFYGCCELYGDIVLGVLFWGFAVQSTPRDKIEQRFPLYCAGANLAQILSGGVLWMVAKSIPGAVEQTKVFCTLGALSCVLAVALHEVLSRTPDAITAAAEVTKNAPKSKGKKPNPWTAFQYCRHNVDIRPLAIMAGAAGIISNTLEIAWKVHLSQWLTTPELMTSFMGKVSTCAGLTTMCLIPLSTVAFRTFGWSRTAKATPNLLLLAGVPFFLTCIVYQALKHFNMYLPSQHPLLVAISVSGAALYVGFRSAKFALYKPAEEMVYKKLDERAQTEGKAAVDVVAAQFGKTGSSLGTQGLLLALPWVSMVGVMGVLSCAFLTVGSKWRSCITGLSGKMDTVHPVTAADLAADALEWGSRQSDWGEMDTASSTITGDMETLHGAGVLGSREVWGSDEGPMQPGVRCNPVLA